MTGKLIFGVGINDADYVVKRQIDVGVKGGKRKRKTVWTCPYYQRWRNMLQRCYSEHFHSISPTYVGCSTAEEWKRFSTFKAWMEGQDWEGKVLDKDILFPGNKVYSPETCVFVDVRTNSFLGDSAAKRGDWPIGACWDKSQDKFISSCHSWITASHEFLGYYDCPNEAHLAWKKRKHELSCALADEQTDPRVAEALRTRYL